jgi:phenylacetate-CoA ligase
MINPEAKRQHDANAFSNFLSNSVDTHLQQHQDTEPTAAVLELFHDVAATVPAYQAFLTENGINPNNIQTFNDFQTLPPLTKENYLQQHPLPSLCRSGRIETNDAIAKRRPVGSQSHQDPLANQLFGVAVLAMN